MENTLVLPPFVTIDWLTANRADVVLADTRWYLDGRSGLDAYRAGHLPGAVFVDLDKWLSAAADEDGGRNPLPHPAVFAEGMSSLGIGDSDTVVAYDDAGGVIAARLVWMLRATGHRAAILDAGPAAWSGELERGEARPTRSSFETVPWPTALLAGIDEAAAGRSVVLDARPVERYEGQGDPVDPRPGHIPGAVSLPCRENLDTMGRLLPASALRAKFETAGVADAAEVISYCGSGVTACHTLLTLEHVGLGQGRLFVGGWSQYARDTHRIVETGRPTRGL